MPKTQHKIVNHMKEYSTTIIAQVRFLHGNKKC